MTFIVKMAYNNLMLNIKGYLTVPLRAIYIADFILKRKKDSLCVPI